MNFNERLREPGPRSTSPRSVETLSNAVSEMSDRAKVQAIADGVDEHVIRLAKSVKTPMIEPNWAALRFG